MSAPDSDRGEFDEGWKEIIGCYFPQLMEFFFPEAYQDIDFNARCDFLDTELERFVKESASAKRWADKLIRVTLKNGQSKFILIHIDVQGYYDPEFAKRMYIYNYRIFDRYDLETVSLAILADDRKNFRPSQYEVSCWGFRCLFQFPVVKLLDYLDRWAELEASPNPFGIVVMAHLTSITTTKDDPERATRKKKLMEMLYERGYSEKDILNLYRFIDWVISLPEGLEIQFHEEVFNLEKERKMPYITTAERIGLKKGREEGILEGMEKGIEKGMEKGIEKGMEKGIAKGREEGLQMGLREAIDLGLRLKFGVEGLQLMPEVNKITDTEKLHLIKEAIETAHDLQEVRKMIAA